MVRSSIATIVRPLASNRDSTSPTRPRRTASGLIRRRVRCDMAVSLVLGPPLLLGHLSLGLLDVDAASQEVRRPPQGGEHGAEEEHRRDHETQRERHHLHQPAQRVADPSAEQPGRDHAEHRQAGAETQRPGRTEVRHPDGHHAGEEQHHRLEAEDRRAHRPLGRPLHALPRGLSIPRASPPVITEPVTTPPPEPIASPNTPPSSARVAACSMASSSRGATYTRSMPKTPRAPSASSSAGSARGLEFWVQTTAASTGSKAASTPS